MLADSLDLFERPYFWSWEAVFEETEYHRKGYGDKISWDNLEPEYRSPHFSEIILAR